MKSAILEVVAGVVVLAAAAPAWALGFEKFGNEPLEPANYEVWPGLARVVNHPSRVYQQWLNGGEKCYFRGTAEDLNAVLLRFAVIRAEGLEVILLRGPGRVRAMNGKLVEFDWSVECSECVAAIPPPPRLTIFVGESFPLAGVRIPKRLNVFDLLRLRDSPTAHVP